jgi:uncharacterized protein YcbX
MSWLHVGDVGALHRVPVKSMLGEDLDSLEFEERGAIGDRLWAVRMADGKHGAGKNTPRFRTTAGLRACSSTYDGDVPCVTLPDGRTWRGDDPGVHEALSAELDRPVVLAKEANVSLLDAGPGLVHILSTAAVDYARKLLPDSVIDERRFRPTLLLTVDGGPEPIEEAWVGRTVAAGSARFEVIERTERCVMVNHDRAGLPRDGRILRALATHNDMRLGVYAKVVVPGTVHVGDRALLD